MSNPSDFCIGCINDEYPEGLCVQIESLRQQLGTWQADNQRLRDALKSAGHYAVYGDKFHAREVIEQALAMPSDSTALDTMLKQAKREALLEAADMCDSQDYPYRRHVARELRRRAEEMK